MDPQNMTAEVYELENASYKLSGVYGKEDALSPGLFPELEIDLTQVFKVASDLP